METKTSPVGHQTIMPYLMVQGAEKFSQFIQKVFNAKEKVKKMRDGDGIMHAEIMIGESTIMFCDSTAQWKPMAAGMFVYVDNADDTYKKALDAGATSITEPSDQSYGRSGGVTDPFGNVWWITSVISYEL